jgi:hypothetical protein
MRQLWIGIALIGAGSSVAAQAPQVSTVELVPASASVRSGEEVKFTVRARDATGNVLSAPQALWLIGPFEVASVDQRGTVRAFRQGSARVVVRVGAKTAAADITVLPKPPVRVETTAESAELVVGGITLVRGVPTTEDGEPLRTEAVTYRSSNPGVASVDPSGAVTGKAPGTTTIIAESGTARGEAPVRVIANPVSRLEVTGPATARTGDVTRFAVRAFDSRGQALDRVPVRWSQSSGGATVYPDGGFVAEVPGSYVVSAAVGNITAAAPIAITPRVHNRTFERVGSVVFGELQAAEHWAIGDVLYVSTIADRLYTFDITDPANPRKVDSLMVDARLINDVSTTADGKIGLITRQGASSRKNGIVFIDLASPLHPKILSEYTATVSGGVHSAFIDGHYVYLTDDGTRAMKVISFADPRNPREVGQWQMENTHFRVDETGQTNGRYLHDIQVKDGLAYLAYFKDGLVILDVGNGMKGGTPEQPKLVSRYTYNTTDFYPPDMLAGTHTVFRWKNYLIAGDEVFPQFFDSESRERIKTLGRLHILDVSDIEHPKKVAEYSVPNNGSHNVWVEDDVLYVGNFEAGVRAVDVSGELRGDLYAQGREIGSIWAASPNGYRPNIPMTWGAQPHKGHVFATDMNSGVWVGRLTPRRLVP